jgi:hypothetical protein
VCQCNRDASSLHPDAQIPGALAALVRLFSVLWVSGSATNLLRLLMQHLKQAPAKAQANQKLRRRACRRRGLSETRPTRFRLRRNVRAHCCLDARGVADVSWDVTQDRQVCALAAELGCVGALGLEPRAPSCVAIGWRSDVCCRSLWVMRVIGLAALFVCSADRDTTRSVRGK